VKLEQALHASKRSIGRIIVVLNEGGYVSLSNWQGRFVQNRILCELNQATLHCLVLINKLAAALFLGCV